MKGSRLEKLNKELQKAFGDFIIIDAGEKNRQHISELLKESL